MYKCTPMDTRLNKVKKFYHKHKRMPSFREMKDLFSLRSVNSITKIVQIWIENKIVEIVDKKMVPADNFFSLPLLGSIKAGPPSVEDAYETESVSLDHYLVGNPGYTYLLRVSGDSMINAGINDGDLVIIDKKREHRNGDIVAAHIDGQWTLKYIEQKDSKIRLLAANPKYNPIVPEQSLSIGGVVVSVIRQYYK